MFKVVRFRCFFLFSSFTWNGSESELEELLPPPTYLPPPPPRPPSPPILSKLLLCSSDIFPKVWSVFLLVGVADEVCDGVLPLRVFLMALGNLPLGSGEDFPSKTCELPNVTEAVPSLPSGEVWPSPPSTNPFALIIEVLGRDLACLSTGSASMGMMKASSKVSAPFPIGDPGGIRASSPPLDPPLDVVNVLLNSLFLIVCFLLLILAALVVSGLVFPPLRRA